MSTNIVSYTDILEIKSELGIQQDSNGQWIMWQIPIDGEVLQHYTSQANEQTTTMFGDLSGNALLYALAKQYATKWASLRIVQTMTINWQISGMQMGLGNLNINRLPALQAAAQMVTARLTEDLNNIYVKLCDVSVVNSYTTTSPYIQSKGGWFWP